MRGSDFGQLFGTPPSLTHRYVMFYLPFDIGYKVFKFLPVKVACAAMKEVYRAKKVHDGVSHAAKMFPNAYLVMIVIGAVKGNGPAFVKLGERLI